MSLADRLRDLFSSGAGSGAAGAGAAAKRRARNQAQPLTPGGVRSYDAPESGRPMARAQWIGLGLAAALAVALTAALVFVIMSVIQPSSRPSPTPTALPVAVVSPTPNSSIADIFATFTPTPITGPSPTPQPVIGQRLQVAGTGNDGANLRREPGQSGERIKTIREGTVLEVVGADRTVDGTVWRNVRDTQGESGWIAASFLAAEGSVPPVSSIPGSGSDQPASSATIVSAATAVPKPTSPGVAPAGASRGQVGNTNGQGANIRSEPGSGGRVLKTVAEGTNLEVLGPEREVDGQIWRQVRDSSGVTGWIIRGAVAPPGTIPTPVPPAAGPTRAPGTAQPSTTQPGATQAPAAKPTTGTTGAPPTAAPTRPTPVPGNLPIIIQPATPRPGGGTATPTPRP